jgi:selenide,water dikinase
VGDIPILPEALDMYRKGMSTGVNKLNRRMVANHARFEVHLPAWHEEIVFDPQTSGGLLVAVSAAQGQDLTAALKTAGVGAAIIGEVRDQEDDTYLIFQ